MGLCKPKTIINANFHYKKLEPSNDFQNKEKQFKNKISEYDDIRKKVNDNESFKIEKNNNNIKSENHKKLLNIF